MYCKGGYEKVILLIFYLQLWSKPMVSNMLLSAPNKRTPITGGNHLKVQQKLFLWTPLIENTLLYFRFLFWRNVFNLFARCRPHSPWGFCHSWTDIIVCSCVALIIVFTSTCIHQHHPESKQQSAWMRKINERSDSAQVCA